MKMHQVPASRIEWMTGSDENLAWIAMDNSDSSGMTTTCNKKATVNVFVKGRRAEEDAREFKEKAEVVFFNLPATNAADIVEDAEMEVSGISLSLSLWSHSRITSHLNSSFSSLGGNSKGNVRDEAAAEQAVDDNASGDASSSEDGDDSSRCLVTGGKYKGHSGTIIARNKRGAVKVKFDPPVIVDGDTVEETRGYIPQSNFEEM